MNKGKYTTEGVFKILGFVTEIAVARERNEAVTRVTQSVEATITQRIEGVDQLVRTLFSTMCELYEEATP